MLCPIVPLPETAAERPGASRPALQTAESIGSQLLARLQGLEALFDSVVASWHNSRQILQARRWHRIAYPRPIGLTPLDAATLHPAGPTCVVQGRDLSVGGLSFSHRSTLACRLAAVTLWLNEHDCETVAVRLTWCRFTAQGVYQSGGSYLRRLETRPFGTCDWRALPQG